MATKPTAMPQPDKRNPEFTPLPGGGCWHWDADAGDDGLGGWVPDTPADTEPPKE